MTAKYPGRCCICRKSVLEGARIFWNNDGSHKIRHCPKMACKTRSGGSGYSGPFGFDSGIIIVGGGDQPTRSLDEISNDEEFKRRKRERENLRECYN